RRYLPYMPDFGDVITVRHLIYHTSGLRDSWRLLALGGVDSYSHRQQAQIVNMAARQRGLNFKPGTEYAYSNMNYTLLAEIVRSVTGKTLRQFTTERMFKPLQMDHTFFSDDILEIVPRRAQSYSREGDAWRRSPLNLDTYGATNLQTTVKDFARWADNFARPKVGERALLEQFTSMGKLDDGTAINYGFALHSEKFLGRSAVAHTGSDAGFRAIFAYFPEEDFAIALLSNSSLSESSYIEPLVEIYLGAKDGATKKPPPPPRSRAVTATNQAAPTLATLRELEGDYRSSELDATYTLTLKGQALTLNSIWFDEPMLLESTGKDAFLTDWPVERIRVERDARGRATAIVLSSGSARNIRFDRLAKAKH
ncbi:serine hydrolase domain-containing protein, partial [Steroidobacter sp.]|uniref:serine hydrolase domain-containing protein n=1 Tax=Steroidobacter sp. TaxID=1978227 RepID=UPI001A5C29DD